MPTNNTKADIINDAYSKLRISGITVIPSPENIEKALFRLENYMRELLGYGVDLNYTFEEFPDTSSEHNLPLDVYDAVGWTLAQKLMSDFGKGFNPDPILITQSKAGTSYLFSRISIPVVQYPNRMPIGTGNRSCYCSTYYQGYYNPLAEIPIDAKIIYQGETKDYNEDFNPVIDEGETISTYTITTDDGLTKVSDSESDGIITYRISASDTAYGLNRVFFTLNMDSGRVLKTKVNFNVKSIDA